MMEDYENVDPGVIEKFLDELPDKAFHLGIRIVLAILVLLIGIQLIKLVRKILKRALFKSHVDESAIHFIDSFSKYALYFLLIILIASWLGVDAASIIAILGSVSVAIGLALQGSLSNLAGGVLILILKPFGVGDYIKDSQGNEGTVSTIDVFYTQITTFDNKIVVLPNGALANGCITNYTRSEDRRVDIKVSIAYNEDIRRAKEVLFSVLSENEAVLKTEEMAVLVDSLGDNGVNLILRCWVKNKDYWPVYWGITEEMKYALDEEGITIPYPQMDVHIDK